MDFVRNNLLARDLTIKADSIHHTWMNLAKLAPLNPRILSCSWPFCNERSEKFTLKKSTKKKIYFKTRKTKAVNLKGESTIKLVKEKGSRYTHC